MRIAMVAPVDMRVPPVGYGGIELVVSLLTEELVRRRHSVTLFASGDSITSAGLVPACEVAVRGSGRDIRTVTLINAMNAFTHANDFDLIHNHTMPEGLALAQLVNVPVLTTLHGRLAPDAKILFREYDGWYNTISKAASAAVPAGGHFAGIVYSAIDCASYPFNMGPRQDYMLFLSRMSHEKGPHLAVEVARRLGRRLVMAGNVHPVDEQYFESSVLPYVDGSRVQYVGEADALMKRELMSNAACLLAPITWPEPFGLFLIEAMACGTPVIAMNNGSVPELVINGETGLVVGSVDEMVEAVAKVNWINPQRCRQYVEERFDVPRMADDYLAVYRRVLTASALDDVSTSNGYPLNPVP